MKKTKKNDVKAMAYQRKAYLIRLPLKKHKKLVLLNKARQMSHNKTRFMFHPCSIIGLLYRANIKIRRRSLSFTLALTHSLIFATLSSSSWGRRERERFSLFSINFFSAAFFIHFSSSLLLNNKNKCEA
jgi:hypothetical protein